jgi:NAD(P)H-dependent flavin oxidoreductase YrpB (nitropropane dioxygenase family)
MNCAKQIETLKKILFMEGLKIGNLTARVPIIQGGMGVGISLSGLASAVANEGGVGVISCAGLGLIYREKARDYMESCIVGLKEEIRKAKEKTSGIVGVNIMMALTNFGDMVKTAIAEKADVICPSTEPLIVQPNLFLSCLRQELQKLFAKNGKHFMIICPT